VSPFTTITHLLHSCLTPPSASGRKKEQEQQEKEEEAVRVPVMPTVRFPLPHDQEGMQRFVMEQMMIGEYFINGERLNSP
jgi:hypothetical protein